MQLTNRRINTMTVFLATCGYKHQDVKRGETKKESSTNGARVGSVAVWDRRNRDGGECHGAAGLPRGGNQRGWMPREAVAVCLDMGMFLCANFSCLPLRT